MTPILLVCCLFGGTFETVRDYTLPENQAIRGIPEPVAIATSEDGRVFLIDGTAGKIFVWDGDGSFLRTLGEPGRGAGKFTMRRTAKSRAVAFLDAREDGIYLYDGGQGRMHVFDPKTYALTDSYTFKVRPGQPIHIGVVEETQLLVNWIDIDSGRNFNAALFNPDKYTRVVLAEMPDISTAQSKDENDLLLLTYKPFSPELAARYDQRHDRILWGDGSDPVVYRLAKATDGTWQREALIQFEASQEDVLDEDKRKIMRMPFLLQGGNTVVNFPKQRPYFNDILPYGESGYLVSYRFLVGERVYGVHIDYNGKVLGEFDREVNEGEIFDASRGKLFHVETVGGLVVHQLRLK